MSNISWRRKKLLNYIHIYYLHLHYPYLYLLSAIYTLLNTIYTIQVQQPVQFAFQPSSYSGVASTSTAAAVQSIQSLQPLQYTTSTLGAV